MVVGRERRPAAQAHSTATFISGNTSLSSLAQVWWYCSSTKVSSRRWWMLQSVAVPRMVAIGLPAVVHAQAGEVRQDADCVGGHAAALGMYRVVRQLTRAGHMRPGQSPTPTYACLVVVQHSRSLQRRLESCLRRLRVLRPSPSLDGG